MADLSAIHRIDCHAHYYPTAVGDTMAKYALGVADHPTRVAIRSRSAFTDLDEIQALMQRQHVDLALIVPNARVLDGLRSVGGSISEQTWRYNQSMSEDLDRIGGGFLATATVDPLGGKDEIAQLDHALTLPNIVGIGLTTHYDGVTLDDPRFEPIFEIARANDVPVTIHPEGAWPGWMDAMGLRTPFLRSGFAFLVDDALCIFRMAIAGIFDRYPTVRFMFCQLGGAALCCCRRWDHSNIGYRAAYQGPDPLPSWAQRTLSDYLSHVWLDTHTQDRQAMQLAISEAGDQTVVLGGDFPVTEPEQGLDYALAELDALGLTTEARANIEYRNALALLGPQTAKIRG